MPAEIPISSIVKPLLVLVAPALKLRKQLVAQKKAGQNPLSIQPILLDTILDETLANLSNASIDDTWWRKISNTIVKKYVSPKPLETPALQDWLSDNSVKMDLKHIARLQISGLDSDYSEEMSRLSSKYSELTGENRNLAEHPINIVLSILFAGWFSKLDDQGQAIAAVIQASASATQQNFQELASEFGKSIQSSNYLSDYHSKDASDLLNTTIIKRSFWKEQSQAEILSLVNSVFSENGNLSHTRKEVKAEILYWACRLLISDGDPNLKAREYLLQLNSIDPSYDTKLLEALLLSASNDIEAGVKILRDLDTADGRSTLFTVFVSKCSNEKGIQWFEEQERNSDIEFFTGIGWVSYAVTLAQVDRWDDAVNILHEVSDKFTDWPDLIYIEGLLNSIMLLPLELRQRALIGNEFLYHNDAITNPETEKYRNRAYKCLPAAHKNLEPLCENRATEALVILTWLKLSDQNSLVVEEAKSYLLEKIKDNSQAISFIRVAFAFQISFDYERLAKYLEKRKKYGGLGNEEIAAEVILYELSMDPKSRASYLEKEQSKLEQIYDIGLLVTFRIKALVEDKQLEKARSLLNEYIEIFSSDDHERLSALIDKEGGVDQRKKLEDLYKKTKKLIDLRNLVEYLAAKKDWIYLTPLQKELFDKKTDVNNAEKYIFCMENNPNVSYTEIYDFLCQNDNLTLLSQDLKATKAWVLFKLGKIDDAYRINNDLLKERTHINDTILHSNLAIYSGRWEEIPTCIQSSWENRDSYNSSFLLQLSSLAAEVDSSTTRAIELAKLAAIKGNNDPNILVSAYVLATQMGKENEIEFNLLSRAAELSSKEGPIVSVGIKEIIESILPSEQKLANEVSSKLIRGEVPIHVGASILNIPLSRYYLGLPQSNIQQSDGRKISLVPLNSGKRNPIEVKNEWKIGLDMSSILVLHYLGILKKTLENFDNICIAHGTMEYLMKERREIRFHQPSLIEKSIDIQNLVSSNRIKIEKFEHKVPEWLLTEVGSNTAELLEAAKQENAFFVHPSPIFKIGSFMQEQADLREYSDNVLNTITFASILKKLGIIDSSTFDSAIKYLKLHDESEVLEIESIDNNSRFYLDDLAITYLNEAKLLKIACSNNLDIRSHQSIVTQHSKLIEENHERDSIINDLENIRIILRDAISSNKVKLLSKIKTNAPDYQANQINRAYSLIDFNESIDALDAVCIDDRNFNSNANFADKSSNTRPLINAIDLIKNLENRNVLSQNNTQAIFYKMRKSGFALVPIEINELEALLSNITVNSAGDLNENAELKAIRQNLAICRSLELLDYQNEYPYVAKLRMCGVIIFRKVWQDNNISIPNAKAISSWLFSYVLPFPTDWIKAVQIDNKDALEKQIAEHISWLLKPMVMLEEDRKSEYDAWVEKNLIKPNLLTNPNIAEHLATIAKNDILNYVAEV